MLIWLAGYAAACWYFVPRLGKLSADQADMRSLVTGRVVDSYTNIPTVKLFAHADREDGYAQEGMAWMLDTVNRSMRMSTLMTSTLQILSGVLIFTMSAMSIWLWYNRCHHHRAPSPLPSASRCASRPCRSGSSGKWPACSRMSASSRTASRPSRATAPSRMSRTPSRWSSAEGAIRFEDVTFNYGKRVDRCAAAPWSIT